MQKLTQTWGERMAKQATGISGRYATPSRPLAWLSSFVRRMTPGPAPATKFARVEPGSPRSPKPDEEGALIPADVREKLRDIIGPGIERARIHTGPQADAFARAHGADAVTVGSDIAFRDGHYRPHEPQGLALLAHEATHVVAGSLSTVEARATAMGIAAEEHLARAAEAQALAPLRAPVTATFGPAPRAPLAATAPAPATPAAATPAAKPMAAASDRGAPVQALSQSFDVNELKRSIYRELLQTIRSDAERGG